MSESKVCLSLVSRSIDFPVAVSLVFKDCLTIHCLHFSQAEVTGFKAQDKTIAILTHLLNKEGEISDFVHQNL